MANENTLGAPTEGLGQIVTFGFKVPGDQGSTAVRRGSIHAGAGAQAGGAITRAAGGVEVAPSPALDMLMKVGASMMDKEIKDVRTAAFVSGMSRAMNGEAVNDIANDQPSWSRVFGDSDTVEGARQYGTEAKVNGVLLKIENDMPELRKMPPAAANAFFTKQVQDSLTGHAPTDAAIMSSVQRNLPAVMKRQATGHYAWMQENAAGEEANAIEVAATRLQNAGMMFAEGTLTEADFAEQQASVGALTVPAVGRDLEHVQKQRTASAMLMAEQGQFHALNAMTKVGMFEVLTPLQRAQIQRSRDANESQWRTKYGVEYGQRIASLKNLAERPTPNVDGNYVMSAVNDMNADYKRRTGSATDFFDPNIVASYGERTAQAIQAAMDHQKRENDATAKALRIAGDKAGAAKVDQSTMEAALNDGTLGAVSSTTSIKEEDVTKFALGRMLPLFTSAISTPAADFAAVARSADGSRYANKVVVDRLRGMVIGAVGVGGASPSFINVYEGWRKLNENSPTAAALYYGDADAKFRAFSTIHPQAISAKDPDSIANLNTAFNVSFGTAADSTHGKLGSKEDIVKLSKTAVKELSYTMPEVFGGARDFNESMASALADKVKPFAELYGKVEGQESAFKLGLARAQQLGLNVVGGYFWQDRERPNLRDDLQKRLKNPDGTAKFAIPSGEEFGSHVGDIIDEAVIKAGGMDVPVINRQGDMLVITGYKDGKQRTAQLEYNFLAEQVMLKSKQTRDGTSDAWWRFGPNITYSADPNAPSIYAGPEKWQKYHDSKRK